MSDKTEGDQLHLSDLIAGLRDELMEAAVAYKNLPEEHRAAVPPMAVKQILVEAVVVTTKSEKADGKVNFYIYKGGLEGSNVNESTQKITLQLTMKDGEEFSLGD